MELVYLWVEEYKNIKNQGFNFSPRFKCDFDGKILVIDKKDYMDIFPKKTNVVAIVGKNGSGKSSIAKIILMLIFYKKFASLKVTNIDEKKISSAKLSIQNNYVDKMFLIVRQNDEFKKITIGEKYETLEGQDIENINEIDFFSIHFNYMLDTLYDGARDDWVKNIYHRNDNYSTPILLEPYKNADNEEKIDLKIIEYLNNQRMLRFYSEMTSQKDITKFFNPNKIRITLAQYTAMKLAWQLKADSETQYDYIDEQGEVSKLEDKFRRLWFVKDISISKDFIRNVLIQIRQLYADCEYKKINKLYVALKVLSSNRMYILEDAYNDIESSFLTRNYKYRKKGKNKKEQTYIDNLIDFDINKLLAKNDTYEVAKIEKCIKFEEKYSNNDFKERFDKAIDKTSNINDIKEVFEVIPPWLEVEFFQNEKSIKSLSSGEKGFLSFIINVLYQLNNISYKSEYSTINLFLDETDVGFHPEWQRRFISDVLFAIEAIWDKDINIIVLTHSPFILSDLPKENIVFLDKFDQEITKDDYPKLKIDGLKNGNCINVTEYVDIKPFGANIHTLLSHGFFMRDGLMGEFAKEKITEILNFLNNKEALKTIQENQIKPIIESIGEDFLKNKLLSLYFEKFGTEKEKRIIELKSELERLTNDSTKTK